MKEIRERGKKEPTNSDQLEILTKNCEGNVVILLLRRRTLDGDACCPHEGGCPPELLQVAIELVP